MMIQICSTCFRPYDDVDHLTICPHNYFHPAGSGNASDNVGRYGWKPGEQPSSTHGITISTDPALVIRFQLTGTTHTAILDQAAGIISGFLHEIPVDRDRITLDVRPGLTCQNAYGEPVTILDWTADIEYRQ